MHNAWAGNAGTGAAAQIAVCLRRVGGGLLVAQVHFRSLFMDLDHYWRQAHSRFLVLFLRQPARAACHAGSPPQSAGELPISRIHRSRGCISNNPTLSAGLFSATSMSTLMRAGCFCEWARSAQTVAPPRAAAHCVRGPVGIYKAQKFRDTRSSGGLKLIATGNSAKHTRDQRVAWLCADQRLSRH